MDEKGIYRNLDAGAVSDFIASLARRWQRALDEHNYTTTVKEYLDMPEGADVIDIMLPVPAEMFLRALRYLTDQGRVGTCIGCGRWLSGSDCSGHLLDLTKYEKGQS